MSATVRAELGDVLAEQENSPGCRPEVSGDLVEQRCLSRAVRADYQPALAGHHLEAYVLRGRNTSEKFPEIDEFKDGRGIIHRLASRPLKSKRFTPGTMPSGMTSTMNRKMKPSSMFQRSI